jgi:hypothetical protein
MEQGLIAEQGAPLDLLQQEDGLFRHLVDELGEERKENFMQIARARSNQ